MTLRVIAEQMGVIQMTVLYALRGHEAIPCITRRARALLLIFHGGETCRPLPRRLEAVLAPDA
jgi:hypothetical protein